MKLGSLRWWSWLGVSGLVALLAIQFVPYGRHHLNPAVMQEPHWDSPATRELARQACFDCHSNETRWPVYSNIAPASWLVEYDVVEGRRKLNFSEWQRPQEEADEAAGKVREGDMPPLKYSIAHGGARLTDAQRASLAAGLAKTVTRTRGDEREGEHEPR